MSEVGIVMVVHRLIIDASIFNPKDLNGVFNWLMEVRGFKRSIRIEQLSVWFARRDEVVYDSTDESHIDSFCESLDALDVPYKREITDYGVQ